MSEPKASESVHWYDRSGKPVYQVPRADGKGMKDTTLREARQMQLVPGVSGVIAMMAKPALETWKVKQGILAALTLPRKEGEPEQDYLDRIMEDSREQAKKAAEKGTAIHASLQGHYEGEPCPAEHWDYVRAVTERITAQYGPVKWRAESSFAHPLGYGGKRDLVGIQIAKERPLIIDFKTKEFSELPNGSKNQLAWDEHCIQLAAYGAEYDDFDAANVFVSTSNPGLVHIHEWTEAELKRGWRMFKSLLNLWQEKNRYMSGW